MVLHLVSVLVLTGTALSTQRGDWELDDPLQYLCYAAFAWLAFALRLPSPIAGHSLSMGFVFVVVALNELTLRECLQICGSVILIQSVLPSHRTLRKLHGDDSDTVQLLSALLSTGTAILVSQLVYTAPVLTEMKVEVPVRLVLAATACLFANHLPLALIYAITDKDGRRKALHACHFWSYPYYLVAAALAAAFRWPAPPLTWAKTLLILPLTYGIYCSYRLYVERLSRERRHSDQVGNLHLRTIEALSLAIEARDGAPNPVRRVQVYCEELGKALRLQDEAREALRAAALLYDIGKLAVPEHIRSKPGRLTPEEYDKIKIHPGVGADILEHVQFPYPVVPIVRFHHERWDGSGYPEGRKGADIPAGARILAVADTIDALTSDRPYRAAMPIDRAIDHVSSLSGVAFDPQLVDLVRRNYQDWEEIIRTSQPQNGTGRGLGQVRVERGSMPANGFESTGRFLMTINAARQEAQSLFDLTQRLGASLDLHDTCSALESGLKSLVPFDTMALYIQRGDVLVPQHVCGDHLSLCASIQSPMGKGLSGWVAAAGKPILNGDPSLEFGLQSPALRSSVFASAISVPLAGTDSFRGALTLYGRLPEAFSTEHLRVLNAIAPKLGPAIENGLKFKVAENSSTTDYLTGLPNAQSLFRHLERELALSRCLETQLAVVVCDLDGFKQVNDRFGHLTGNDVLRALGEGLRDCCRDYDYVARMGGDEFVLVFYGMTRANVNGRLDQLRDMVITIGQGMCHQPVLDASFGVAFFPADGQNAEELLAAADRSMYQVKDGQRWERETGRYENVRVMPRRAG
ncbi:MAG: diguanylate cyclase [Bryobacteraceae bacterium]|nr:diguanylate cyclase [Bryobacteraceae bacterium]